MSFDQSFYNESSLLSISVMVVDDDPVFLQVMSRMLEKSKYREPSLMEITVIAVKDSMEALSTLKTQRNNIDLIVTDYYMPGMNGLQLKSEITREYGNLPVIVMSSDANKEQESLTCGAMCFIPKPIKPIDLTKIYHFALTYKRNGKSTLRTEQSYKEPTNVSVPRQIQLLPEQGNNVLKTKKKKYISRTDSRSVNSPNESGLVTDGSRKRKSSGGSGDDVESDLPQPSKKKKITWSDFLQDRFLQAIRHIGLDKAVPKKILEFMNVPYLTRENVASHLQKYRIFLRKVVEKGLVHSSAWSGRDIESKFPYSHMTKPYYNYYKQSTSWYDTSLNDRSFYSKPMLGHGQSRLLSNAREPVRFNQSPYNYMNRSTTYDSNRFGSNLTLPINSNLNFSKQPSQNEGRRSFLEPPVMVNQISQTSQGLGFGQHGPSAINGNSFNSNMNMSSYGGSTLNQPRQSNYGSLTPNQPRLMNDYGSSTLNQPGLSSYGSLTPNQQGPSINGSSTLNQPGLSSYGSLTPNQQGLNINGSSTLGPSIYGGSTSGPSIYGGSTSGPSIYGGSTTGPSIYGGSTTGPSIYGGSTTGPSIYGGSNQEPSIYGGSTQGPSIYGGSTTGQSIYGGSTQGPSIYGGSTQGPSIYGGSTQGPSIYGSSTPNQSGLNIYGTSAPNQSNYKSSTPNQSGLSIYGSSTLNQPELTSYGSLTPNQLGVSSYGSLTPNQTEPNHFTYGMQSFLNNENAPDKPQSHANATTQPNHELPQLENLNLYANLGETNELPCNISNFQFDHNQQQEEDASTNRFELPADFTTELNQILNLEEPCDWTFVNVNQGYFNGETSNPFAAPETNSTIFNMNPNPNQEQDVPDFIDWSLFDTQDLVDDDFMKSLFNDDMN